MFLCKADKKVGFYQSTGKVCEQCLAGRTLVMLAICQVIVWTIIKAVLIICSSTVAESLHHFYVTIAAGL